MAYQGHEWVWVVPGTCFQGPEVLFQDVFPSLLNVVLPTKRCPPKGLRQMDLDCEWSQKAVLIIQIDYGLFLLQNLPVPRRSPGCVKDVMPVCEDAHPCPALSLGFWEVCSCSLQWRRFIVSSQEAGGWCTHLAGLHHTQGSNLFCYRQNLSCFWFRVGNSWPE